MRLPSVAFALCLTGCGGSASETPFPVEPVPEYARAAAEATSPAPAQTPGAGQPNKAEDASKPAPRPVPSGPSAPSF